MTVLPGSVAEKASIQKGDVILQYGDIQILNKWGLQDAVKKTTPGSTVFIKIWRGSEMTVTAQF